MCLSEHVSQELHFIADSITDSLVSIDEECCGPCIQRFTPHLGAWNSKLVKGCCDLLTIPWAGFEHMALSFQ